MRGDIVEVDLSAAQFAELLTTMNVGLGVPCTIRHVGNRQMKSPPDIDSQPENIRTEFKENAKKLAQKILSRATEAKQLLKEKASLNKSDRERISNILTEVARELEENMPFMVEMYQEATEKIETAAKAEVEAFMVGAVRQAGLAALAAGQVDLAPPQLPAVTTPGDETP
jgi:chorismate mutase